MMEFLQSKHSRFLNMCINLEFHHIFGPTLCCHSTSIFIFLSDKPLLPSLTLQTLDCRMLQFGGKGIHFNAEISKS